MSCERENKYWNEKKFHFLDYAMVTELMSTAYSSNFVSFRFGRVVSLFCNLCWLISRLPLVVMNRVIREIGKYPIMSTIFEYL